MFWDVLDESRIVLLKKIISTPPISDAYLAGETALALQFGHRESIDFDWFTPSEFSTDELARELSEIGQLHISEIRKGTFHGFLDGIQVTWLLYPNPLLDHIVEKKFPSANINHYHMLKSLTYFDDAEQEGWPKMHHIVEWSDLKSFFITYTFS